MIIAVLMLGSLGFTWIQVYFSDHQLIPILLNKGFSTTIAVAVSLFIYYKLMYKEADTFYLKNLRNQSSKRSFTWGICYYTLFIRCIGNLLPIQYKEQYRISFYYLPATLYFSFCYHCFIQLQKIHSIPGI